VKSDRFIRTTISFILFLALSYPPTEGENGTQGPYELGEECFQAREYEEAYQHFLEAFEKDPGDLRTNFALGRAAFEMGNYETAAMAFERLLIKRPNLNRVKLELARCYYQLESYELARQYLQEVLDTNPPSDVRTNVESMMDAIDTRTKKNLFSGMFGIGYNWDSNARISPGTGTIDTARGERTVSRGDRLEKDGFSSATLVLDHKSRLRADGDVWWRTTAANYSTFYNSETDLDINYYLLATGPTLETQRFVLEARGLFGYMLEGRDRYLRSSGGTVSAATRLNKHLLLAASARVEDRKFYEVRQADALNVGTHITPTIIWGPNRLMAQAGFEDNDAKDETQSYDRLHALLRYERELPHDFTAFAGYRLEDIDFDRRSTVFGKTRKDRRHLFSAGLTKKLWRNLSGELGYGYIKSHSRIELYEYDRHLASFGLSVTF
jgi:tetratricopeptide (TPR) repeat protein